MEQEGSIFQTTTDSEIVLHLIARSQKATLPDRVLEAVGQVEGAISCLVMNEKTIVGWRDPHGFRPLVARVPRRDAHPDVRELRLRHPRRPDGPRESSRGRWSC